MEAELENEAISAASKVTLKSPADKSKSPSVMSTSPAVRVKASVPSALPAITVAPVAAATVNLVEATEKSEVTFKVPVTVELPVKFIVLLPKVNVGSVPPEASNVQTIADPEPQVVVPTSVESKFKVMVSVSVPTVSIPFVPPATSTVLPEVIVWSLPVSPERVNKVVPVDKQVEQVISPKAERAITPEAETATVPEAFGKVQVLSATVKSAEVMMPLKVLVAVAD